MKQSPEAAFVTACVAEVSPNELAARAGLVRDWSYVARLAMRHRVMAYVLRTSIPDDAASVVRRELLASQAVCMLLDAELRQILAKLGEVRVLVLKGPALARTLYHEMGLRPHADLDLVVRQHDEARAVAALESCGYTELPFESNGSLEHGDHGHGAFHRLFAGANGRALVELHLEPLQMGLAPLCEAERWQRAVPLPGLPGALMLAPADQVVTLSVHAHKHGYSRLLWLKDLDLLLRTSGAAIDWSVVVDDARREGVAGSVWLTLTLTSALLGTPLPEAVQRLRPGWLTRRLYAAVWPMSRVVNLEGFLRRRAVQLHVRDSWRGVVPSLVLMGRRRARLLLALRHGLPS